MQTLRKGKEMRFELALKAMREGKRVRKRKVEYFDSNVVFYIIENKMFHDNIDTGAYKVATSSLRTDFIVNSDWEVVEDE